ncbi:MAG: hypothetical protein Ta2B_14500 [Termitinemataceae bacterium]|nr:MAG: hypothetical protein Ta2B_14500 [Termitinemataceae bacterium]
MTKEELNEWKAKHGYKPSPNCVNCQNTEVVSNEYNYLVCKFTKEVVSDESYCEEWR